MLFRLLSELANLSFSHVFSISQLDTPLPLTSHALRQFFYHGLRYEIFLVLCFYYSRFQDFWMGRFYEEVRLSLEAMH
jgi:hypothetical protein